jgi:tRNA threonylcarbamoyladenosine modification (KEOPS) complex Cgi121 subunit
MKTEPIRDLSTVIIKRCSSRLSLDKLLALIGKANEGSHIVQIFDPGKVIGRIHLLGAYVNAVSAFDAGTNVSKSVGMEMLLFAAMTRQINDAIKRIGAKSNKDFILFACDDKAMAHVKDAILHSEEATFTQASTKSLMKSYGITVPKNGDADQFMLQKMTMSALGR